MFYSPVVVRTAVYKSEEMYIVRSCKYIRKFSDWGVWLVC